MSLTGEFDRNEVQRILEEEVHQALDGQGYDPRNCKEISDQITKNILNRLDAMNIPDYKYLLHCLYIVDNDQEFETFSFNFWDPPADKILSYDYQNGEVRFILTMWALKC